MKRSKVSISLFVLGLGAVLAVLIVSKAYAEGEVLVRSLVGTSGSAVSGATTQMRGTAGQMVVGATASGVWGVCSGFECVQPAPVVLSQSVYLPLLRR
jgi:hypothetical protein